MKKLCPLINDECREHGCAFYGNLQGQNPQTGEQISQWDCAIVMLPLLLVENAQQGRQTGAAIESFRNEVVRRNDAAMSRVPPEARAAIESHLRQLNRI